MSQLVPDVKTPPFLEGVYTELVRNTYLLIHKGRLGKNELLEMRATQLLIRLLDVPDFPAFLSGEDRGHAG